MLAVLQGGVASRRRSSGGGGSGRLDRAIACLGWRQKYLHAEEYPLEVRGVTMPLRQLKQGELRGLGTGATVWAAAHVLCKYLERRFGGAGGEGAGEDGTARRGLASNHSRIRVEPDRSS